MRGVGACLAAGASQNVIAQMHMHEEGPRFDFIVLQQDTFHSSALGASSALPCRAKLTCRLRSSDTTFGSVRAQVTSSAFSLAEGEGARASVVVSTKHDF